MQACKPLAHNNNNGFLIVTVAHQFSIEAEFEQWV